MNNIHNFSCSYDPRSIVYYSYHTERCMHLHCGNYYERIGIFDNDEKFDYSLATNNGYFDYHHPSILEIFQNTAMEECYNSRDAYIFIENCDGDEIQRHNICVEF